VGGEGKEEAPNHLRKGERRAVQALFSISLSLKKRKRGGGGGGGREVLELTSKVPGGKRNIECYRLKFLGGKRKKRKGGGGKGGGTSSFSPIREGQIYIILLLVEGRVKKGKGEGGWIVIPVGRGQAVRRNTEIL